MDKSTEGVVLKDGQIENLSDVLEQLDIISAVNEREREARSQFVQDLKRAIGDLTNRLMPIGIKPTLQRLIQESGYYIEHGNENAFVRLCNDAIEVCRQGWSVLSYWMTSSQNICYAIYWSLRDALDKHKKEMLKVTTQQNHDSKNDAVSSCSDNPNAARKKTELSSVTKYSFPLFNSTLMQRMLMQCGQEQSKKETSLRVNPDPFASCVEIYKNKF